MRVGNQNAEPLEGESFPARHVLSIDSHSNDIAAMRPICAILSRRDYWQLNEHRRRCEYLGGAGAIRLAHLLRAKMADAIVVDDCELYADVVSGTSRVTFSFDGRRLETRVLYHWSYPENDCSRLHVGTFLGATLIGMTIGQRMPLLAGDGTQGEVQVLRIHTSGVAEGMPFA
jgi:transcription elongation GreA/GreB family factor